jgi:uncharacterized protein YbcI
MPEAGPTHNDVEGQVSAEIGRILEESYGAGAKAIATHYVADVVMTIIDVELTTAERVLLQADQADAVQGMREAFQTAIAATFVASVERATGRRVQSFMSHMSIDPLYSVELFRLEPSP